MTFLDVESARPELCPYIPQESFHRFANMFHVSGDVFSDQWLHRFGLDAAKGPQSETQVVEEDDLILIFGSGST